MKPWGAWAAGREWPLWFVTFHDVRVPLDRRKVAYAECQGSEDPFCGQCRFSVHGCNDDGPSRAEFLHHAEVGVVVDEPKGAE